MFLKQSIYFRSITRQFSSQPTNTSLLFFKFLFYKTTDRFHTNYTNLIVSPDSAILNKKRHGSLYPCLSWISGLRIAYSVRIDNAVSPRREEYTKHLPNANVWIDASDGRFRCRIFLPSQSCEVWDSEDNVLVNAFYLIINQPPTHRSASILQRNIFLFRKTIISAFF